MKFLEKDLEEILFDNMQYNSGIQTICDAGYHIQKPFKSFRQLKIGDYGVADIVTIDRAGFYEPQGEHMFNLKITVFELKKEKISMSAFLQAVRYCKGIESYMYGFRNKIIDIDFKIVLIGKTIDKKSSFTYLSDYIESDSFTLKCYTYDYEMSGLKFKSESGYSQVNEGFES